MLEKKYTQIFKKILTNPGFAYFKLKKTIYSIIKMPFNILFFKKFGRFSYISHHASIINKPKIKIGSFVEINRGCCIWPLSLDIADGVQINPNTVIYGIVSIGENTMIGPNCNIIGGNHNFANTHIPMKYQGSTEKGIKIGNDVWIGASVTILDGVTIGSGSIIGAGSIVTKDLPPFSISVGNPIRIIKIRT